MKKKFKILYIDTFTNKIKLGYDEIIDLSCFVQEYGDSPIGYEYDTIEKAESVLESFLESNTFKKQNFKGYWIIQPIYYNGK